MNKDESLALYAKGKDAWNAWAEKMLAERAELEKSGRWEKDEKATETWKEAAEADFSGCGFGEANFSEFIFPGDVNFSNATFSDDASFYEATFSGYAWFRKVTFSGIARFNEVKFSSEVRFDAATFSSGALFGAATFSDDAWLGNARFSGYTLFDRVTFSGNAWFGGTVFRGYAAFTGAIFENQADFIAMKGESFFSLEGAIFRQAPDFGQAHFTEAPRLDNSVFHREPPHGDKIDLSARWRALKRLAVQGHDHEREQFFFAEEIKALRGVRDKFWPGRYEGKWGWPGGGRYWGGWFYQVFSDFGRSMSRPVLGWLGAGVVFAFIYLSCHFARSADFYPAGTFSWTWRTLTGGTGTSLPFDLACVSGSGHPLAAAVYLAVHKGSIVAGLGGSEKIEQIYACLYGILDGDRYAPVIPDAIVYAGLIQTIFSASTIFFFLLAVRNHFRIK